MIHELRDPQVTEVAGEIRSRNKKLCRLRPVAPPPPYILQPHPHAIAPTYLHRHRGELIGPREGIKLTGLETSRDLIDIWLIGIVVCHLRVMDLSQPPLHPGKTGTTGTDEVATVKN